MTHTIEYDQLTCWLMAIPLGQVVDFTQAPVADEATKNNFKNYALPRYTYRRGGQYVRCEANIKPFFKRRIVT